MFGILFIVLLCCLMMIGVLVVIVTQNRSGTTCRSTHVAVFASRSIRGSRPKSLAVDYFNNDEILDVVVANSLSNNIGIFFGYGQGIFSVQTTYATGEYSFPYFVDTADLNKDNQSDIVVANYGTNEIAIFLAFENGTFHNRKTYSTQSSRPIMTLIVDVNHDERFDIVTVNYGTQSIGVFLAVDDGIFEKQVLIEMNFDSYPRSISIADMNNDDEKDIVVANFGTNNIQILYGYGNGSFSKGNLYATGGYGPIDIDIADFNQDNVMDIAVVEYTTGQLKLLLGYANGSFQQPNEIYIDKQSKPMAICISDFNSDTLNDIVITNSGQDNLTVLLNDGNGSFILNSKYSTGLRSEPSSIICRDMNRDNRIDILLSNTGTNNFGILLNYDTGAFRNIEQTFTDQYASVSSIIVADFNHDQHLDIAVARQRRNLISVFLGYGNGLFFPAVDYATASQQPIWISVADFNDDNHLDLVTISSYSNSIDIYFGYGNGSFIHKLKLSTGRTSGTSFGAIADFNHDSHFDIVVANNFGKNIGIFLGYGNGSFSKQNKYPTGKNSSPISIAVADFNGDGNLDVAVANGYFNNIEILLGSGDGHFYDLTLFSTISDSNPQSIVAADLNQDAHLDLVVVYVNLGLFAVFFGVGDGIFRYDQSYLIDKFYRRKSIAIADLNNDRYLDIFTVNQGGIELTVFFGLKNGKFSLTGTKFPLSGDFPISLNFGDFNNDTRLDIVVGYGEVPGIEILLGYDRPEFLTKKAFSTGENPIPSSLAFADFNDDNKLDMVVTNYGTNNMAIYLGIGNGSFNEETVYSTGTDSGPYFVLVDDINNDLRQDVFIANSDTNNFYGFLGIGDGTFLKPTKHSTDFGSKPYSIGSADFNTDGLLDMVVANYASNNIEIFLQYQTGSFTVGRSFPTGGFPLAIAVADFNNDNKNDIVVVTYIGTILILFDRGDGTFNETESIILNSNRDFNSIVVNDINNDNQMDLIVTSLTQDSISIYFGLGNGTFKTEEVIQLNRFAGPISAAVGHLNNDNWLDIVVGNYMSNSISVVLATKTGTFSQYEIYCDTNSRNVISVLLNDLNNDKTLDIVILYNVTDEIGIMFGYGNGSFKKQHLYSTGSYSIPQSIVVGDVNNDTHVDIIVGNSNTSCVGVFYGFGNGTFSKQVTYFTGSDIGPTSVTLGDFNNDNKVDIAVIKRYRAKLIILLRYNEEFLATEFDYSLDPGSEPVSIVVTDFNRDNHLDIAILNYGIATISILFGQSYQGFLSKMTYGTGKDSQPYALVIADLNKDNRSDIIVANSGTNTVGIFFGEIHGYFRNQMRFTTGNNSVPRSIAVADFNNDRVMDIVVANYGTDRISIFLRNENGTLLDEITYSTGTMSRPTSVVAADFNKDSQIDIAIANSESSDIIIFYGIANGHFMKGASYSIGYGVKPVFIAIADVNNDDWLDIAICNYGSGNILVLMHICS